MSTTPNHSVNSCLIPVYSRRRRKIHPILPFCIIFIVAGLLVKAHHAFFTTALAPASNVQSESTWTPPKYVAHALGKTSDGTAGTNSKEALENSYVLGYRTVEVDLVPTSDGNIVLNHVLAADYDDFIAATNSKTFLSTKINNKYTPLALKDLVDFMKIHPDLYVITDTKTRSPEINRQIFSHLLSLTNNPNLLNRFIVQLYDTDSLATINAIYPWKSYILTLYKLWDGEDLEALDSYAAFAAENHIQLLTVSHKYYSSDLQKIADTHGIPLALHTVNSRKKADAFFKSGVDSLYTDKLH